MNIENIGYGWGVWLLVEDDELNSSMSHQAHITVMCNMERDDAIKLFLDITDICGELHIALCNNTCERFEGIGYSKNDPYPFSSGYYCDVEMWDIISYYCKKRLKYDSSLGSFSEKPHMTYCYSNDIQKIKYLHLKNKKYLKCKLVVADIRNSEPFKWSYS
jgi:hypothetical protein